MNETVPQLLATIPSRTPASVLEQQIMVRIRERIRVRLRRRVAVFGIGSVLSIGLIVELGTYLVHAIVRSGFISYLSLALSGDGTVFKLWKELSMSLFESLPLVGVIGTLVALAFVVWTVANVFSNMRKFDHSITA